MSAIQSSVGLVSGIPIQDTVDQLIAVAGTPRNQLASRTEGLLAERSAVDTLAALVLGLRSSLNAFNSDLTFNSRTVTSSHEEVLSVAVESGASPNVGSYLMTPLQTASAHQLVSASFSDLTGGIGAGTLKFRFGGHVDSGIALSELNAGAGFAQGEIKITDRSGASAVIDLRAAQSVDDILDAVNSNTEVNVTASVAGDALKLTDHASGAGTLSVQEVGLGTAAKSLGLDAISTAASEATGTDILELHDGSSLASLNNGAGVRILDDLETVDDLTFTFDANEYGVDLSGATTLGDVVQAINSDDDLTGLVTAKIAADGNRLEVTDLSGATTFAIASVGTGAAAEGLGLTETASGGVITGSRLVSGLAGTLVKSLNGGQGFSLEEIVVTDRSGDSVAIDLSTVETLADLVTQINDVASGAGVEVVAAINASRNGIQFQDTSGSTSGNLKIANGASGTSADDLNIAVDDAVTLVNSGTLNRQVVSEGTLLASLNGGTGVSLGDIRITDSNGAEGVIDLNSSGSEAKTVGDVLDAINSLSIGVQASINDTGDGVLITDTAEGNGILTVAESGSGSAAAGLKILGASTATNGVGQQILDGVTNYEIDLSDLSADASSITLDSLNNGSGVELGIFQVTDSAGISFAVVLNEPGAEAFTVGDVLQKINDAATAAGATVTAQVSDGKTGIQLVDTAGGGGKLTVKDLGTGRAAADLGIVGEALNANASGEQTIASLSLFDADDAEKSALELVAQRVNDLKAGISGSVVFDGTGYRLSLAADRTGVANELLVDDASNIFSFQEVSQPQDGVLLFGASTTLGGVAISSSDNQFDGVVEGLNLTVGLATGTGVTVQVESDVEPLTSAVQGFVDAYNSIRDSLASVTAFDSETSTTGVLFGRNEAIRVDTALSEIASGAFSVAGEFGSLEGIGVSLDDQGKLSLDANALMSAFEKNPGDLERFLNDETNGVFAKFDDAISLLASGDNALLSARSDALQSTIDANNERIVEMDASLERQRETLLLEFIRLEETIASLQSNFGLLESISFIQPQTSSRSN